jgi:hypothetical protein
MTRELEKNSETPSVTLTKNDKLNRALYEAAPSLKSASLQAALEADIKSILSEFNRVGIFGSIAEMWRGDEGGRLSDTQLMNHIINSAHRQLTLQQQERRFQARSTFIVALSALILGVILIIIGVFCAFFINLSVGTVTCASSVIMDIVGVLCFRFHKEANDRYDKISQELRNLTIASTSMHYITIYISDPDKKDQAISDLIKQLHSLSPNNDTTQTP